MKNNLIKTILLAPIFLAATMASILTVPSSARGPEATAGFVNAAPGGGRARFEVKLFRFIVDHETWDDALERDGKRDEVSFSRVAFLHNRNGSRVLSDSQPFTPTSGESPPNAQRAGHASNRGGLQTGDDILLPPVTLFSEELIQGESAATIIVSAWEMDGPQDLYQSYQNFLENSETDMLRVAMSTLVNSPQTAKLVREWDNSFTRFGGFPTTLVALEDGPGLGAPNDRPIGMIRNGNHLYFIPKLIILNFDNATLAAQTNEGSGVGVIKISYQDDEKLAGNYTLFLKITRV